MNGGRRSFNPRGIALAVLAFGAVACDGGGGPSGDLGGADAKILDLAMPDLAAPVDLGAGVDMAAAVDMALPADLAGEQADMCGAPPIEEGLQWLDPENPDDCDFACEPALPEGYYGPTTCHVEDEGAGGLVLYCTFTPC